MTKEERLERINRTLAALGGVWDLLQAEIQSRIEDLTNGLIAENDEQKRGAIKELRNLLNLPEALQHERDGITAALSDPDAAD